MAKETKVILRKSKENRRTFGTLNDSDKFKVLQMYTEGKNYREIGKAVGLDGNTLSSVLSTFIRTLSMVQETNKLENSQVSHVIDKSVKTCKEISEEFVKDTETNALIFAWYYGKTNDIRYSLKASDLDKGIPPGSKAVTKNYILRVRGQYLLSMPAVRAEVNTVREQELKDNKVDRKLIQSEILGQLEEEKLLREENPQSRQNSIKLIQMLGNTVNAFSTTINVSEVNPEDSLQMLIEMAEKDMVGGGEYTIEDVEHES